MINWSFIKDEDIAQQGVRKKEELIKISKALDISLKELQSMGNYDYFEAIKAIERINKKE